EERRRAGRGHGAGHVLRRGRMGARGPAGCVDPAARKRQGALLRARGGARHAQARTVGADLVRRVRSAAARNAELRLDAGRIRPAQPLQQGIARQAGLPRRSAPRRSLHAASWPAGRRKGGEMSAALAIDVRGLNKSFGDKHVVRDLSLQVEYGQILGFLGPNGSGKTTSIRMLCGLLRPDSGSGTCLGYDVIRETAAIKREVGYMTQGFSLWGDLTIRENLDFVARMYGMKDRKQAVAGAIDSLGLGTRQ